MPRTSTPVTVANTPAAPFTMNNQARTFGVEIELVNITASDAAHALIMAGLDAVDETAHYSHAVCAAWKIMRDGSVHSGAGRSRRSGIEVVSPVLSGDAGLRDVFVAVSALKAAGAKVNMTCGLHVHHGASDLTVKGAKTLVMRYAKAAGLIDAWAGRGSVSYSNEIFRDATYDTYTNGERTFARLNAATNIREVVSAFRPAHSYSCNGASGDGRCGCSTRYAHINFGSFWKQGTVEFRQHKGSVNAKDICAWVVLTQSFMEQANNGTPNLFKPDAYAKTRFFNHLKLAHYSGTVDPRVMAYYSAMA